MKKQGYKFIRVGEIVTYKGMDERGILYVGEGKYLGRHFSTVALADILIFEGGRMKHRMYMQVGECFDHDENKLADDDWANLQEAIKLYNERTGRNVQITELE